MGCVMCHLELVTLYNCFLLGQNVRVYILSANHTFVSILLSITYVQVHLRVKAFTLFLTVLTSVQIPVIYLSFSQAFDPVC